MGGSNKVKSKGLKKQFWKGGWETPFEVLLQWCLTGSTKQSIAGDLPSCAGVACAKIVENMDFERKS